MIVNSNFWRVNSLNAPDVSAAELETHLACCYVADFFHRRVPGFERAYIAQIATDLGIRTSRGIEGEATLTTAHTDSGRPVYFDDAIGCVAARADFEKTGVFYHDHGLDIPYRIMLPIGTENLLVGSGKSVSCQPQKLIRGMASCMVVGQAAGAAAALSAKEGVSPRAVDVRALQCTLLEQGVDLGPAERTRALGLYDA